MASQPAGRIVHQDNTLADTFIRIPDDGIPDLDNQLEEDIHLDLEGVQDEELFADGFVDEGLEVEEEDHEDNEGAAQAGGRNGRRGPDLAWTVYREFDSKAEFDASEIPAYLESTCYPQENSRGSLKITLRSLLINTRCMLPFMKLLMVMVKKI